MNSSGVALKSFAEAVADAALDHRPKEGVGALAGLETLPLQAKVVARGPSRSGISP